MAPEKWPAQPLSPAEQRRRDKWICGAYIAYLTAATVLGGSIVREVDRVQASDPATLAWAGQCALRGIEWRYGVLDLALQVRGGVGDEVLTQERWGGLITKRLIIIDQAASLQPNDTPPADIAPASPTGIGLPVESFDATLPLSGLPGGTHNYTIMLHTKFVKMVQTDSTDTRTAVTQEQPCRVIEITKEAGRITSVVPVN